jgi:membrane protein implicated in regulation of membrane protease activity
MAGRRIYRRGLTTKERPMLWLIVGIVLLVIAIAGGAIVHPILFALGILALVAFFAGSRGRAV